MRRYVAEVCRDIWQGLLAGLDLLSDGLDRASDGLNALIDLIQSIGVR